VYSSKRIHKLLKMGAGKPGTGDSRYNPATQEADIRRITVRSQPRQIVHKTLSRKNPSQKNGLVEWLKV
jgi:hypothetical protein